MARFRTRSAEVEAEPYRPGLEDGFTRETVPVLVTPSGRFELDAGDWIVTRDTGEREVVKARDFQARYEPCAAPAGPRTNERISRGVPMRSG